MLRFVWLPLFAMSMPVQLQQSVENVGLNLMKVSEEDVAKTTCTMALLRKYFASGEELSGSVLSVSVTTASLHLQQRLLHHMHSQLGYPWTLVTTSVREKTSQSAEPEHVLYEKPQCYFVVVGSVDDEDLDELFEDWRLRLNWNPLSQFVIYLDTLEDTEEEMTDLMVEIFLIFMHKKVYNVNVIGQSRESRLYLGKTVFPYHPDNNCGNRVISVETLDGCDYQDKYVKANIGEHDKLDQKFGIHRDKLVTDNQQDDTNNESHTEASLEDIRLENTKTTIKNNETHPNWHLVEYYRALFVDKLPIDLKGCPLIAAYRPWEPYIFRVAIDTNNINYSEHTTNPTVDYFDATDEVDYEDDNNGIDRHTAKTKLAGIEYQMVQTIAEHLHLSISLSVESSNPYHLFQQLIDGEIQMIIGGIDEDPNTSQFVSSTIPYNQDDLTWCVTRAERIHSFYNFLASYKLDSWLLVLSFVMIASFTIMLAQIVLQFPIKQLQGYLSICVRVLGIVFSQSLHLKSLPTSLHLMFGACYFMSLIFSNTFQSFLISTVTTPRTSHQISNLEEIYTNQFSIMGSVESVRHLDKDGEVFKYLRQNYQMCYNIVDCLNRAANGEHIAVAVSRQHSFYNPRIQRDRLYCFDRNDNLNVYLVAMLVSKNFHLLHQINPIIQHIIESGHMQKWARDLDMRRKIHERITQVRERPFKRLTLTHFCGPFVFASGLLLFAVFVFALEHFIHWLVVEHHTRLKIARYLHKKFRAQLESHK